MNPDLSRLTRAVQGADIQRALADRQLQALTHELRQDLPPHDPRGPARLTVTTRNVSLPGQTPTAQIHFNVRGPWGSVTVTYTITRPGATWLLDQRPLTADTRTELILAAQDTIAETLTPTDPPTAGPDTADLPDDTDPRGHPPAHRTFH